MISGVRYCLQYCHLAWIQTDRKAGGLGDLNYPLVADLTKEISKAYNVLIGDVVSAKIRHQMQTERNQPFSLSNFSL